ncbi:MAG: hypothetical protein U0797_14595 [Gemmataceae bacterium]
MMVLQTGLHTMRVHMTFSQTGTHVVTQRWRGRHGTHLQTLTVQVSVTYSVTQRVQQTFFTSVQGTHLLTQTWTHSGTQMVLHTIFVSGHSMVSQQVTFLHFSLYCGQQSQQQSPHLLFLDLTGTHSVT